MRAVQAALALLLAAAGAKNHGDELALFVRQYAEKNDKKVDVRKAHTRNNLTGMLAKLVKEEVMNKHMKGMGYRASSIA